MIHIFVGCWRIIHHGWLMRKNRITLTVFKNPRERLKRRQFKYSSLEASEKQQYSCYYYYRHRHNLVEKSCCCFIDICTPLVKHACHQIITSIISFCIRWFECFELCCIKHIIFNNNKIFAKTAFFPSRYQKV